MTSVDIDPTTGVAFDPAPSAADDLTTKVVVDPMSVVSADRNRCGNRFDDQCGLDPTTGAAIDRTTCAETELTTSAVVDPTSDMAADLATSAAVDRTYGAASDLTTGVDPTLQLDRQSIHDQHGNQSHDQAVVDPTSGVAADPTTTADVYPTATDHASVDVDPTKRAAVDQSSSGSHHHCGRPSRASAADDLMTSITADPTTTADAASTTAGPMTTVDVTHDRCIHRSMQHARRRSSINPQWSN